MIDACMPSDTTHLGTTCIDPKIELVTATDGVLASAGSTQYELNIALVISLTDASSVACAIDGSAGTSVCYDGVLSQITADAAYEDTVGTYHALSFYYKNDGGACAVNGPTQDDVNISCATSGYTWDLSPTSSTDTTVFDIQAEATAIAGPNNW